LNLLGLYLIDEEFSEVELACFSRGSAHLRLVSHHGVVDLVTFTLNVQGQWSSLSLNVALQVVVVSQLKLGVELNLNWSLTISRNNTSHRRNL
jgi:hypothetical protein